MTTAAAACTVREATRADLLDVFRIERQCFPQPWPFAAFERFLGQPGFLVAERDAPAPDENPLAGYVVADTVPNHGQPLGHIKDLAVHPAYRGQGIGKELLSQALFVLATANASSVKLEVRASNEPAISLYRSFDFQPRRRIPRYYDDGEDAIIMVRSF
ncbi:ribosomal protein S18-alanine N-acetyltransferase [Natronomonas sp. EA1]|uniref:ribosomal protein S18-alanine N-acetyltransferase n=1 Tax=Natronomonas sp. EA1 TaxID=3421655 RepID=UPI003EB7C004